MCGFDGKLFGVLKDRSNFIALDSISRGEVLGENFLVHMRIYVSFH